MHRRTWTRIIADEVLEKVAVQSTFVKEARQRYCSNFYRRRKNWKAMLRIRIHWIRIRIRIWIQHFMWIRTPHTDTVSDPVTDPGFWWPKTEEKNTVENFFFAFLSKIAIYLYLGLHKGRPSYTNLQHSKENIQHFKILNLLIVFYFSAPFLPSRIQIRIGNPDTDLGTPLNPHWIRIRINNAAARNVAKLTPTNLWP